MAKTQLHAVAGIGVQRVAWDEAGGGLRPHTDPVASPKGVARQFRRHERTVQEPGAGTQAVSAAAPSLRRTFATDLLNRGVGLESVAQLLGHASSQTTQRYYAELLPSVVRTEFYDAYETPAPLPRPPEHQPGERPRHLQFIAGGRPA